jgi:hypothetical protein
MLEKIKLEEADRTPCSFENLLVDAREIRALNVQSQQLNADINSVRIQLWANLHLQGGSMHATR